MSNGNSSIGGARTRTSFLEVVGRYVKIQSFQFDPCFTNVRIADVNMVPTPPLLRPREAPGLFGMCAGHYHIFLLIQHAQVLGVPGNHRSSL